MGKGGLAEVSSEGGVGEITSKGIELLNILLSNFNLFLFLLIELVQTLGLLPHLLFGLGR